jgi:hypothetical protein
LKKAASQENSKWWIYSKFPPFCVVLIFFFVWQRIALHFHHFIKKELSDYPVDAIRMAVSFLYII